MDSVEQTLRRRWRIAIQLTLLMVLVYFGFLSMVAFRADLLAINLVPGLSVGIVLGVMVIGSAWVLTYVYAAWANAHLDPAVEKLKQQE